MTSVKIEDGWLGIGFNREDKETMTDTEARFFASLNTYNNKEFYDILSNHLTGYIRTCNGDLINSALSKIPKCNISKKERKKAVDTIDKSELTISLLDEATRGNTFMQDTDVYSMVGFNFLKNNFEFDINFTNCSTIDIAFMELMKLPVNYSFIEYGFTSCSYNEFGSEHFRGYPVELIIHCSKDQTYYQTKNFQEKEIILPRNIKFGICGLNKKDTDYGEKIILELYILNS